MTNKAETTLDMYQNIQDVTLFALRMLKMANASLAVARNVEIYGISEERIEAIRDFYTSDNYKITEEHD